MSASLVLRSKKYNNNPITEFKRKKTPEQTMSSNRSVPIVIINSENIPNKIRNIDDIEYELSQVNSSGQKSTPTRKSKGRSLIKCKSFDFISRIRCI